LPIVSSKEEEKNVEQHEEDGEGSNLGDPVSDPGALGTIEDF
jgi:hypothetical protein